MAWLTWLHTWLKRLHQRSRQVMPPWLEEHTLHAGIVNNMPHRHERVETHAASKEGMQLGDEVLLQLIAGGNQPAFRTLYDRYSRRVFSLALHITGDRRIAEEVTEDVFVLVWQHHRIGQSRRGTAEDWIAAITRTRALDRLGSRHGTACQRAVVPPAEELVACDERDPFEPQAELRDTWRQALATLPADQRQVLERAYYGGRTTTELAADLAVSVSTITSRVRLAFMNLREAQGQAQGTHQRERGARSDEHGR